MEGASIGEVAARRRRRPAAAAQRAARSHSASVGKPRAGPARVRVGLEVAQVAHGRVRIDLDQALQRVAVPCTVALLPIQRRAPAREAHPIPAHRQPQLGAQVAAVVDECEVFAIGHRARRDLERRRATRDGEAFRCRSRTRRPARRCGPSRTSLRRNANQRSGCGCTAAIGQRLRVRRVRRVERQHVLDVGEQQLLVLLFMMQAERDQICQFGSCGCDSNASTRSSTCAR